MHRTYKTEGFILKQRPFGEADRLLTVYSKHYGKICCLAKGVRRLKSRKAGSLELFSLSNLFFARGRNLDLITEAVLVNNFSSWRQNLARVGVAFYFAELVDKLNAEEQPNRQVFGLIEESFARLKDEKLALLVQEFEKRLLTDLGFGVPENRNRSRSLRDYIEEVIEKPINTPRIVRQLF